MTSGSDILSNLQISANYRYVYSITSFRGVQILGGRWRYRRSIGTRDHCLDEVL